MLSLYIPDIKDYWYEEKIQSDQETMSYNAGYDVNYAGYHYDTGCIDFPKERWQATYQKRLKENIFFAYLKDDSLGEFVGYVNYYYNKADNRYDCSLLIENKHRNKGYGLKGLQLLCQEARKNGLLELYDNFEVDRKGTLSLFMAVGFKIVEKQKWSKFNKQVEGVLVKIDLTNITK